MAKTKKVGIVGRYGTRYGVSVRRRIKEVEDSLHKAHTCPACNAARIRRQSKGVWTCGKCGLKFSGGAYVPVVQRDERPEHEERG